MNEKYKKILAKIVGGVFRARAANLISLPKTNKTGANCANCHYFKNTDSTEIGYCSHPQVSLFVTGKQVCDNWGQDGAINFWNKTKQILIKDFRDLPPSVVAEDVKVNPNGSPRYSGDDLERASAAGLVTLPDGVKGAMCYTCQYSSPVGWCKNPNINLPIEKTDLCKNWHHPNSKNHNH